MRTLMTCTSGEGHIGPLLAFADAIRRAGGQVGFATRGPAAAAAQTAGFDVLELAGAPASL